MGKPKKYIGETWSNPWDHGGKDYRWDHKKKEYVVSHGESPIASITRALKEKFPDPLKHLDDARDERDNKWAEGLEGIGDALSQDDEAESTLESINKIVDAAATIKKINDNRQKADEPTENENKENIATKSMEHYFNTDIDYGVKFTGSTDYGEFNTEKLLQLDFKDPKQKLVGHNWYVNKLELDKSGDQTNYKQMRKTADERQKRRMEDALAKGNPLKQFELDKQRGVGTPVNELFKKPEDVNNVEQDKQIETEVKNENKEIETLSLIHI